jgi:hypothetical protein
MILCLPDVAKADHVRSRPFPINNNLEEKGVNGYVPNT